MSFGVYFSANDAVLRWAYPFLRSFRETNPGLELIMIPFDEDHTKVAALASRFRFQLWESDAFPMLEAIGRQLELGYTSYSPFWFRRYAVFEGPLEEFVYLDVRQVILTDLIPFVRSPDLFGYDLTFMDAVLDQVYECGQVRHDFLRSGGSKGILSCCWASKKGVFSIDDLIKVGKTMLPKRDQFNRRNTDQAFLNYCLDVNAKRSAHYPSLVGDHCAMSWAGQRGYTYKDVDGVWRLWDYGGIDHEKRLSVINWAGLPFSYLGPQGKLLRRYDEAPRATQLATLLQDVARGCERALKSNRRLNHALKRLARRTKITNPGRRPQRPTTNSESRR